ncbi:MAG: ABC transporter ATP-binding protein [Alphaproteobacteria bacterium]|nr:ABC transporter ATP-binding protein [Alphaproteobacteria bacterium]
MSNKAILRLHNIRRSFTQGGKKLEVLRGCDLSVARGEKLALIGPSGSGKSTLLQIAGLLERPDEGDILIGNHKAGKLDDKGRTSLRLSRIGFVYQFHHLLPEFSARENIMLPQLIAGTSARAAKTRADKLLNLIQLRDRTDHRPAQLSGGEQQRIAIARALANKPMLLIADEPTGNLDPQTAAYVFSCLQDLVAAQELGLLMATHNYDLAARMDRTIHLQDGVLVEG